MKLLKISVKPKPDGSIELRLQGRDDAGNIIDNWVTAPNSSAVPVTIADAVQGMAVLASEQTEEENSKKSSKK